MRKAGRKLTILETSECWEVYANGESGGLEGVETVLETMVVQNRVNMEMKICARDILLSFGMMCRLHRVIKGHL